jgi:hypothetical protein
MNVYLDIDGVLLANELYPAMHAAEFIKYVLTKCPDSTYWLTTHCQGDASRPVRDLADKFDTETVELIKKIKPTTWLDSANKTDAIDFTKPFLWFDDDLFFKEKETLIKHGVLENWIEVNIQKDPDALGKFLNSFPIPINLVKQ